MIRGTVGLIHTVAAVLALLAGFIIFVRPKATPLHRVLGYVYSVSMAVMLITAFFTFNLTKSFNFLHVFAIVSCPPLIIGFLAVFNKRPGWFSKHYEWMCYSYLGLVAAFISETTTRILMPYLVEQYQVRSMLPFWVIVGTCTAVIIYAGVRLIERNKTLVIKIQRARSAA